ncbi:hypothetical protein FHS78_000640 [Parvibaculum indicum]|nr:hypothetical protein [Parvibaculum indicum]
MKILVGCEQSGIVRRAFAALGHDVWSVDLLPSEDMSNRHIIGDVRDYLDDGWDLLAVFHPPCFVAGTLVLTKRGHIPIEDVVVGDLVLTHRGRWRRVTETMNKSTNDLLALKATNALPITTTPEHPFYARFRAPCAHGFRSLKERDGPAEFIQAGALSTRHFVGSVLPPTTAVNISDDDLWLMGRYVADGHMRRSRWTDGKWEEMNLAVGAHEFEEFKRVCPRKCSIRWNGTAYRATFYGHDAIKDFAQFGLYAHKKTLPVWVMELPKQQAIAFLQGYLSGDGYIRERDTSAATVSPRLALGIAILMQRVYDKCPRLGIFERNPTVEIQGRTVRQRPSISISIGNANERLRNYVDGDYAWGHVRSVIHKLQQAVVFNLSVEEDETYTANGVIVHNCTRLCNSGVRWLHEPPKRLTAGHYGADKIAAYAAMDRDERLAFMWSELRDGADLFSKCWNADIPRKGVENPVMHRHAKALIDNYSDDARQTVQPWWFGEPAFKATNFYLEGLPRLVPTNKLEPPASGTKEHAQWSGVHRASPSPDRWKERSKTYPGMAAAIASQWGGYALREAVA